MNEKLYRIKVKSSDVQNMAVAAFDKVHAHKLATARLKEYGFTENEFSIISVKQDGFWEAELETTLIYN